MNTRQGGLILAAGRVRSKKKKKRGKKNRKNPAAPKTHHEILSSPATATTSRRRATEHVPRVSPYSSASIDPGFVEIGLVQLSQSVILTSKKVLPNFGTQTGTTLLMRLTGDLYEIRSLAPKLSVNLDKTRRTSEKLQTIPSTLH